MSKRLEHYFELGGVHVVDQRVSLPRNPAVPWGWRRQNKVKLIVVHHTGGWPQATAKAIAFYHIGRGWPGIAYTLYVRLDGTVDFCHAITQWGPHAAPTNLYSMGIALAGDYSKVRPTKAMVASLVRVINAVSLWYLDHNWDTPKVEPHNAFARTQCPGLVWDAYLEHPECLDGRARR